jgi:hypothetical protein
MKTIRQRFEHAKSTLDEVRAAIIRNPARLPSAVEASFHEVLSN